MEKELNKLNLQELNSCEQENVNGGSIAAVGLFIAAFALGYTIGKDIWGG